MTPVNSSVVVFRKGERERQRVIKEETRKTTTQKAKPKRKGGFTSRLRCGDTVQRRKILEHRAKQWLKANKKKNLRKDFTINEGVIKRPVSLKVPNKPTRVIGGLRVYVIDNVQYMVLEDIILMTAPNPLFNKYEFLTQAWWDEWLYATNKKGDKLTLVTARGLERGLIKTINPQMMFIRTGWLMAINWYRGEYSNTYYSAVDSKLSNR